MNLDQLNRQIRAGHRLALGLEPQLAAVYAEQFRRAGRQAAKNFTANAVVRPIVAAGEDDQTPPDWVPPDVDEVLDPATLDVRSEAKARDIHGQAVEFGVPSVVKSARPEISFDATSPFAEPLLAAVGTKGVNLGLAARDVVVKIIGDSYTAGLSVPNTAAALQSGIDHLADTTALMQARTDLNGLANGSSLQSVQALGDAAPAMKQWLATEDERTRETHADADGQEVPIDQPFQVGDDFLMYPGDPDGSDAEVCNCRCTITYGDGTGNGSADEIAASAAQSEEGSNMEATDDKTIEAFADSGCLDCGHAYVDHLGTSGPCTMDACSCSAWTSQSTAAETLEFGALAAAAGDPIPWRAVLLVEGEETVDGRIIDVGAIDWRPLPLTLMAMIETDVGHDGAMVAGRIDTITRIPGFFGDARAAIVAEGVFDTGDYGADIARMVGDQTLRGVSADLGNVEIQLRPRSAPTYQIGDGEFDYDGDYDDDGPAEVGDPDDVLIAYVKGTLMGATVCPFPAIGSGAIEIADPAVTAAADDPVVIVRVLGPGLDSSAAGGLTAAVAGAVPVHPPAAWFDDPRLDGPTPLTVDDDGRVFGHVATWGVCHIGNPQGPNVCTTAPRSMSGYAFFHLGELITDEGDPISVGQITFETDHAPLNSTPQGATRHYADTGTVAVHARAGEDRFGIWIAGALAEDLPVGQIRKLRAAKLSGDWRKINGRTEMIGVLAVNVPGFPIPRPATQIRAAVDGPEIVSLVAAGILGQARPTESQQRARVKALAARTFGRDELIAIALGNPVD